MARGVNKVILVGNLGNDPEVKYTQGGMAICALSLATTSTKKDRDGQVQERTEWHRVKLFGKLGEIAGEYLKKGRQVYIEGEIRYSKAEGKNGEPDRYYTDIVANEMQMLGGGGEGGGERRGPPTTRPGRSDNPPSRGQKVKFEQAGGRPSAPPSRDEDPFPDDDIPF